MRYLVRGHGGPGLASPAEVVHVLEQGILPTFDALLKLEADGRLLAGGLPVGDRAFLFVLDAASHDEANRILRGLPAWGLLQWEVTPLQSLAARAETERTVLADIKKRL